ncbi:cytochrome P450 6k1-like [Cylas formicarius]|uniref:cytochrome P450 6k1-like n=1 Tax=Cylas formicarius TaxID=197179 RepID=UPI002958386E|nr:cytochrome P450 6k1-like [Cylas formicarius]XP_060531619.1 cytochrome P450 6k1-like [Cylas formicarius]
MACGIYFMVIILIVLILIFAFLNKKQSYWQRKNVFFIKPSILFGNFYPVLTLKVFVGDWLKNLYDQAKNHDYFGIYVFAEPYLILKSPQIVKAVLQKDFAHFENRMVTAPDNEPLMSYFMFFMKSTYWKKIRSKVSPVFTSGKLKLMHPLVNKEAESMVDYLKSNCKPGRSIEVKEVCAKYSTGVIARCAFGVEANCFVNEESEFRRMSRALFDLRFTNTVRQLMSWFTPTIVRLLRVYQVDNWIVVRLEAILRHVISVREQVASHKVIDMIDLLLQIKRTPNEDEAFTDNKLLAQAMQFFTAGFETVSSTIAFLLYELAMNKDVQDRLRREIEENIERHGSITYEGINDIHYLDMCINETLRKYPVLPFLDRRCTNDYTIPGTTTVIEKGTPVIIPMMGIHYDENYYPEPQKYDPQRFADKSTLNNDGYNYFPFGEGPRICIGERFGLLGVKLGIINLLSSFEVQKNIDTPDPLEFDPGSVFLVSRVGVPLLFEPLNKRSSGKMVPK